MMRYYRARLTLFLYSCFTPPSVKKSPWPLPPQCAYWSMPFTACLVAAGYSTGFEQGKTFDNEIF